MLRDWEFGCEFVSILFQNQYRKARNCSYRTMYMYFRCRFENRDGLSHSHVQWINKSIRVDHYVTTGLISTTRLLSTRSLPDLGTSTSDVNRTDCLTSTSPERCHQIHGQRKGQAYENAPSDQHPNLTYITSASTP